MLINTVTPKDLTSLKSYEEIVDMATAEWYPRTNTIAELNLYPEDYYDMLNDWNNLQNINFVSIWTKPAIKWIVYQTAWFWYYICYNNWWTIWQQNNIQ